VILTALVIWFIAPQYGWKIGFIGAALALASVGVGYFLRQALYEGAVKGVDAAFWKAYEQERIQQKDQADLEALWSVVKPGVVNY
jgi:hypothetical protein